MLCASVDVLVECLYEMHGATIKKCMYMKVGCPPTANVNKFRENRSDGLKFRIGLAGKQKYRKGYRFTQKHVNNQRQYGGLTNLTCFRQ